MIEQLLSKPANELTGDEIETLMDAIDDLMDEGHDVEADVIRQHLSQIEERIA